MDGDGRDTYSDSTPFCHIRSFREHSVSSQLRAMTFNLRYATADDAENGWERRRDLVVRSIQQFVPDLLATQEGFDFQIQHLRDQLSDFDMVGVGRDDGRQQGEFVAIYFRRSRYSLVEQGHFWLSETPDTPGSKSWDSRLPRMVTWCTLRDIQSPTEPLHVLNTHFDHRGETARQESAKLLRRHIESVGLTQPIIIMGDFNSGEDDLPYRMLLDGTRMEASEATRLVDAYRSMHPRNGQSEATRHDFGLQTAGDRMDWILHSRRLETLLADIDRTSYNGRYPSDHFPVTAVLRLARLSEN